MDASYICSELMTFSVCAVRSTAKEWMLPLRVKAESRHPDKDGPDSLVLLFTVTTGNQDLCTYTESECHHKNSQIVYTGNGRGSSSTSPTRPRKAVSVMPISCSMIRLIRMGVGDNPYFFVCVFSSHVVICSIKEKKAGQTYTACPALRYLSWFLSLISYSAY